MWRPLVTILPCMVQKAPKWRFSTYISHKNAKTTDSEDGLRETRKPYDTADSQAPQLLVGDKFVSRQLDAPSPLWLRDACSCELCVDPSSKQKRFQTSDIPLEIDYFTKEVGAEGTLTVTWSNDIPGFGSNHVSTFPKDFISFHSNPKFEDNSNSRYQGHISWDKAVMTDCVKFIDFNHYMTRDSVLYDVLKQLRKHGLVFLRNVPGSEKAIEDVAGRIGPLKNTFYGLTWDVKSVPKAKNVAYTHQYLGLHMDLLYTDNPPALQLLHCLKNSCAGGTSLFCDSFQAVLQLWKTNVAAFDSLKRQRSTYTYDNAGEYYYRHRHIIEMHEASETIRAVNWSPPFQAPFIVQDGILDRHGASSFTEYMEALKMLAARIEAPENIYEYRLQEGDCVIFSNRRVLHARTAFDISSGERWLKGAYLDADVWNSRRVVLDRIFGSTVVTG